MRGWWILYSDKALRDLTKLDRPVRRKLIDELAWFANHFEEMSPSPLHGDWKGFFKFRVGDWRVVYDFDSSQLVIRVHQIDLRDKVYKHRR